MHTASSDRALDEDVGVRSSGGSGNSRRDRVLVTLALGAIGVLGLFAVARWNEDAARPVRAVLRVFSPAGFLQVTALVLVVSLALAVPLIAEVVSPVLTRLGAPLRPLRDRLARSRLTVPIALGLLVVGSGVAFASVAFGKTIPLVLGDELLYTDLAKSISTRGLPLVRGELELGLSLLFPLLAAPAYRLTSTGSDAYLVVQTVNAFAFALTAVPAYAFARRLLSRPSSFAVAIATVIAPWLGYPAYVMTESLFYPVLVSFALVLAWTLDRPSIARQVGLLATLALAALVRPQGFALGLAVVGALAARAMLDRDWRGTVRVFAPTAAAFIIGGLVALVLGLAGVELPSAGFGDVLDSVSVLWLGPVWALRTVGIVSLALGVLPVVAAMVGVWALVRRDRAPREVNTALVIGAVPLALLVSVSLLSSSAAGLSILHERNIFYVAPLILTGLFAWAEIGFPRGRALVVSAMAVAICVGALVVDQKLLETNTVDSPTSALFRGLDGLYGVSLRGWLVLALVAGLLVLASVRHRPVLLAWTLTFALAIAASVAPGPSSRAQLHALSWVDRALPDGATATLVHVDIPRPDLPCAESAEYEQQGLVLWTEFFNTSVDDLVHVYGARGRDGIGAAAIEVGDNGVLLDHGKELDPTYAVVDSRQQLAGTPLERFDFDTAGGREGSSLTLWKIDPPLRLGSVATPFPPRADGSGC